MILIKVDDHMLNSNRSHKNLCTALSYLPEIKCDQIKNDADKLVGTPTDELFYRIFYPFVQIGCNGNAILFHNGS